MKSASVLKRLLSPVRTKIKREPLLSSRISQQGRKNSWNHGMSNPTFWRSFSKKWFTQHLSCSWHVFTKNKFRIVTNFLDKKETLLVRRICNYIKNLWNGMFKSCLHKRRFSLTCGSLGLFWFYFGQCTNNGQCTAVNNCVHCTHSGI